MHNMRLKRTWQPVASLAYATGAPERPRRLTWCYAARVGLRGPLTLILLLMSQVCAAGNVARVFGDGVFDLPWGASESRVEEKFPKGEKNHAYGIMTYAISDSRTLFGIERKHDNRVTFTFDSDDQLVGMSIQFPLHSSSDYGNLLSKLQTTFGEYEPQDNSFGANLIRWPKDGAVTVGLLQVPGTFGLGQLLLTIEHEPILKEVHKDELGF